MSDAQQWNDIYIRDNLGDTGLYPSSGSMCHSPDIVPCGTQPIQDPAVLISTDNWGKDIGKDIQYKQPNYIYVRGKNLKTGPQTGDVYLYYAQNDLLLYPDQWQSNQLKTSDGAGSAAVSAAASGDLVVTENPFSWTAPQPDPGRHFCMISRIVTPDHAADIPQTGDIQSLATFVSDNPNFAWRNVTVISGDVPTWSHVTGYTQGDLEADIFLQLVCQNVPVGAQVAFSAGSPGPNPVINLEKTTVTNSQSFIAGMVTHIPEKYLTNITYSYWANGHNPLPGFKITLLASYLAPQENELLYSRGEIVRHPHAPHPQLAEFLGDIGPHKMLKVGSVTTQT